MLTTTTVRPLPARDQYDPDDRESYALAVVDWIDAQRPAWGEQHEALAEMAYAALDASHPNPRVTILRSGLPTWTRGVVATVYDRSTYRLSTDPRRAAHELRANHVTDEPWERHIVPELRAIALLARLVGQEDVATVVDRGDTLPGAAVLREFQTSPAAARARSDVEQETLAAQRRLEQVDAALALRGLPHSTED